MNLTETTKILTRILEQTEYSIERGGDKLDKAKNELIKDSNTKMWIEEKEKRMIKLNEEVDALRQSISSLKLRQEYQRWKEDKF